MKRITAILLSLALCLTFFPASAYADEWKYISNTSGENTSDKSAIHIENNQHIQGTLYGQETSGGYNFSDTHYYQFTLSEESIVSIYLVDNEGDCYLTLDDNSGDGVYFATSSSFRGNDAEHLYVVLEKGTYTVVVRYNSTSTPYSKSTVTYDLYFDCKEAKTLTDVEKNEFGRENFQKTATYTGGQFTDVAPNQWFYENVKTAYELGIVKGTGANSYGSKNTVTLAEALALASRLHSIYHTGKADFKQGDVWYQVYLDYAISNGIIRNCGPVITSGEHGGYAATAATREQFVCMMKNAFPDSEFPAINNIEKGKIPDVSTVSFDADAIYTMYNAGIVTGNDSYGTFTPDNTITRSEVAAIIARMVDSSLRKHFTISDKPIEVTGVSLSEESLTLYLGATKTLKAYVWPEKATERSVTWASSNTKVASVSANGVITAVSKGSAVISATSQNGKSARCTVNVVKRPSISAPTPVITYGNETVDTTALFSDGSGLGFYTNSADGVCVSWGATNQSGKTVNYYTCYITMYNPVGDLAYDQITNRATVTCKTVGPVANGDSLMLTNALIGYTGVCSKIVMDKIYLEYADGSTEMVTYGYSGGETVWNEYWNNFYA